MSSDVVRTLEPVMAVLEELGVTYRVGGSVASSALGGPRSTLDVDIVCSLSAERVEAFVRALSATYYVDADMIRDAIARRASINLIEPGPREFNLVTAEGSMNICSAGERDESPLVQSAQ
jgi:hypothetical protein